MLTGYVVDGGVVRLACGGQKINDSFNSSLSERKYRFSTDAEFQIVRLAVEKVRAILFIKNRIFLL